MLANDRKVTKWTRIAHTWLLQFVGIHMLNFTLNALVAVEK